MHRFQTSVSLTTAHWCIFPWIDGVLRAGENDVYDINETTVFEVIVQKVLQEKEEGRSPKCSILKESGVFRKHSCYPALHSSIITVFSSLQD